MLCVPVNEDIKPLKMYQMVVLKKKKKLPSTITEKHTCMHAAFILKTSVEYTDISIEIEIAQDE